MTRIRAMINNAKCLDILNKFCAPTDYNEVRSTSSTRPSFWYRSTVSFQNFWQLWCVSYSTETIRIQSSSILPAKISNFVLHSIIPYNFHDTWCLVRFELISFFEENWAFWFVFNLKTRHEFILFLVVKSWRN